MVRFDIPDNDGNPITFVIRTDLSPDTIRAIMDEIIPTLKDDYLSGVFKWQRKLAACVIIKPDEYRGREDKLGRTPLGVTSRLYDKISEWYPFWDSVPLEHLEDIRKSENEYDEWFQSWLDQKNEDYIKEEVDIMHRDTNIQQDLVEADELLSSILDHAACMSAEFVAMLPPDRDSSKVVNTMDHMATLKLEVERAQKILRRLNRYGSSRKTPA